MAGTAQVAARARNALMWAVLTASTIGPGSVAMCARAGADYEAKLVWSVVVAALVAWVMQDGAGRLTIVSGRSLGRSIRLLTPHRPRAYMRRALALGLTVSSFAYECNIWAGTADAVRMLTPDEGLRRFVLLTSGPACVILLVSGSTESVSLGLGLATLLLVLLFLAVAILTGLPPGFERGFLPTLPDGSAPVALGVLGTTSPPPNIVLGSALAYGASLGAMREGVAISSALTGLISLLIQVIPSPSDRSDLGRRSNPRRDPSQFRTRFERHFSPRWRARARMTRPTPLRPSPSSPSLTTSASSSARAASSASPSGCTLRGSHPR